MIIFFSQFVFKKYLSKKQWLSLLILTVGCVIQKMDIPNMRSQPDQRIEDINKDTSNVDDAELKFKQIDSAYITMSTGLFFIFIQVKHLL